MREAAAASAAATRARLPLELARRGHSSWHGGRHSEPQLDGGSGGLSVGVDGDGEVRGERSAATPCSSSAGRGLLQRPARANRRRDGRRRAPALTRRPHEHGDTAPGGARADDGLPDAPETTLGPRGNAARAGSVRPCTSRRLAPTWTEGTRWREPGGSVVVGRQTEPPRSAFVARPSWS